MNELRELAELKKLGPTESEKFRTKFSHNVQMDRLTLYGKGPQKCNPKPIMIKTEAKHTIPAHSTIIIYASIPGSNEHPITGTIQPLPQFDECAKLIVAPAITTAMDKRAAIQIANTTDFPHTIAADTKVPEFQNLRPEERKMIRPVDIPALNLLTVVTYINALMQVERHENNEENF